MACLKILKNVMFRNLLGSIVWHSGAGRYLHSQIFYPVSITKCCAIACTTPHINRSPGRPYCLCTIINVIVLYILYTWGVCVFFKTECKNMLFKKLLLKYSTRRPLSCVPLIFREVEVTAAFFSGRQVYVREKSVIW
jgi:hypothetical protein